MLTDRFDFRRSRAVPASQSIRSGGRIRSTAGFLLLALTVALSGCAGESPAPEAKQQPAATQSTPAKQRVTLDVPETLPKLDRKLPPLDEGRVVITGPADWNTAPRSDKYLAMFQESNTQQYPQVIVRASSASGASDLTDENVEKMRQEVAQLLATPDESPEVLRIDLGKRPGLYYKKTVKAGGVLLDQAFLYTILDGRKYEVELRTPKGSEGNYRPYLIAVARGLEFPAASPDEGS